MPQFDQNLLVTLVITTFVVFGIFYFHFNSQFLSLVSQLKTVREKIKSLIKKYSSKNK